MVALKQPADSSACRHLNAKVRHTGRDPDGYKIRLRLCECGEKIATVELPFNADWYWLRDHRGYLQQRRRRRQTIGARRCRWCGQKYPPGAYGSHVVRSSAHQAALNPDNAQRRHWRRLRVSRKGWDR